MISESILSNMFYYNTSLMNDIMAIEKLAKTLGIVNDIDDSCDDESLENMELISDSEAEIELEGLLNPDSKLVKGAMQELSKKVILLQTRVSNAEVSFHSKDPPTCLKRKVAALLLELLKNERDKTQKRLDALRSLKRAGIKHLSQASIMPVKIEHEDTKTSIKTEGTLTSSPKKFLTEIEKKKEVTKKVGIQSSVNDDKTPSKVQSSVNNDTTPSNQTEDPLEGQVSIAAPEINRLMPEETGKEGDHGENAGDNSVATVQTQTGSSHSKGKSFKCPDCERIFVQYSHYQYHLSMHKRALRCPKCEKCYYDPQRLQKHLNWHMLKRPFRCSQCDKSFVNSTGLVVHKRLHTGERPYHCLICYKQFRQQPHLKAHMDRHLGQKEHKCHKCGSVFDSKTELMSHVHISCSKKRSFTCPKCKNKYEKLKIVLRHIRYGCTYKKGN